MLAYFKTQPPGMSTYVNTIVFSSRKGALRVGSRAVSVGHCDQTRCASPESVSIAADPSSSLSACDRGNRTLDFVLILELLPTPVEYDAK